jgi:hypothetical protein
MNIKMNAIAPIPQSLYQKFESLTEVVAYAQAQLPIEDENQLNSLLMTYHNTLLHSLQKLPQDTGWRRNPGILSLPPGLACSTLVRVRLFNGSYQEGKAGKFFWRYQKEATPTDIQEYLQLPN